MKLSTLLLLAPVFLAGSLLANAAPGQPGGTGGFNPTPTPYTTVSGKVTRHGGAASGFHVYLLRETEAEFHAEPLEEATRRANREAVTDDSGGFNMALVEQGDYLVLIKYPDSDLYYEAPISIAGDFQTVNHAFDN